MSSFSFTLKRDYTKKRHNIDILLKRAIKGSSIAQKKLLDEYGIKIYSSCEINDYERGKQRKKMKNLRMNRLTHGSKKQIVKV
ncbi:MAG: hypothetical protein OEV55_08515 [candidate division Zixibacteria bacterium]|nr:hypothetical protein [candidate division Zixibacteria bacterium]